jgi:hypothetical protein
MNTSVKVVGMILKKYKNSATLRWKNVLIVEKTALNAKFL